MTGKARPHETRIRWDLMVGARAISGIPGKLAPFAMVWIRWRGRVIRSWDHAVGLA